MRPGSNRLIGPGERRLWGWSASRLVGCGGRTIDPDLAAPDIERLRRFYVRGGLSRRGLGHTLRQALLDDAARYFRMLTVDAPDPLAAGFYERCGFEPCARAAARHCLRLRA